VLASLDEGGWNTLLRNIRRQQCTPFLGAGVRGHPTGAEIALKWSQQYDYPFGERDDLIRVAQFVAVQGHDGMLPKEELIELLATVDPAAREPHGRLADLCLPLYITTNYDDLMVQALRERGREPVRLTCPWNPHVPPLEALGEPSVERPWVFHLHGSDDIPESIILTEDDYIEFLLALARRDELLPPAVKLALANTSLLFVGYRLADWTFRVIFQAVVAPIPPARHRLSVAVQLPPDEQDRAKYYEAYFEYLRVNVCWSDAGSFVSELRRRMDEPVV
jgi:hypothetical protein